MKISLKHIGLLIISAIFCFSTASAQIDTLAIYKKANSISGAKAQFPEVLAGYLCEGYDDEASKVLAIGSWIAQNINYDYKGYTKHRAIAFDSYTVLKNKKALCGEYAQLFKEMCTAVNIKAEVVGGYTRRIDFLKNDTLFRSDHAWNAVRIDGEWRLFDLTFAAGYVSPKSQAFPRMFSSMFGIPFSIKYKFVKQFQPEWVDANPVLMIRTHLPELPMFQLLDCLITAEVWRAGPLAIANTLKGNSGLDLINTELNAYTDKSDVEKLVYEAEVGYKFNRFNNYMRGMKNLYALDSLHRKYYNPTTRKFDCDKATLKTMKRYAFVADSALKQAQKDLELEYAQKQKRSDYWKATLKANNKLQANNQKARTKLNNQNLKFINKSNFRAISMNQFYLTKAWQFRSKNLEAVNRPKRQDPILEAQGKLYLQQQDSLRKLGYGCLIKMDRQMMKYSREIIAQNVNIEAAVKDVHIENYKKIKEIAQINKKERPLIHPNRELLDKEWLVKNNQFTDSVQKAKGDIMIAEQYERQLAFYDFAKQYVGYTKACLNAIKAAKKSNYQDCKEDSIYADVLASFQDNMLNCQYHLNTSLMGQDELKDYYKKDNSMMSRTSASLIKESDLENFRHKTYLQYRKDIKVGEGLKIKAALKQLNSYSSQVEQGIQSKR